MNKRTKRITLALIGTMLLEGLIFFISGGSLTEVIAAVYAFFKGEEFAWPAFLQGLFWSVAGFFLIGIISGPKDQLPPEEVPEKEEVKLEPTVVKPVGEKQAEEKNTKEDTDAEEIRRRKERLKSGRLFGNK